MTQVVKDEMKRENDETQFRHGALNSIFYKLN